MGSKSIWDYANDMVQNKIAEHTYQIDTHVKRDLDRIYKRAKSDKQLEDSFKYS